MVLVACGHKIKEEPLEIVLRRMSHKVSDKRTESRHRGFGTKSQWEKGTQDIRDERSESVMQ